MHEHRHSFDAGFLREILWREVAGNSECYGVPMYFEWVGVRLDSHFLGSLLHRLQIGASHNDGSANYSCEKVEAVLFHAV
jgi:hypothetical protein